MVVFSGAGISLYWLAAFALILFSIYFPGCWVLGAGCWVGVGGQWLLIGLLQIDGYSALKCIFPLFLALLVEHEQV